LSFAGKRVSTHKIHKSKKINKNKVHRKVLNLRRKLSRSNHHKPLHKKSFLRLAKSPMKGNKNKFRVSNKIIHDRIAKA